MKLLKIPDLPKFSRILLVVTCSGLTFYGISKLISRNLVQYTHIPEHVFVKMKRKEFKSVYFKLPSGSMNPIDSDTVTRVYAKEDPWEKESQDRYIQNFLYHENPTFLVWTILISITVALAAGICPVYLAKTLELKDQFKLGKRKMTLSWLYAVTLVVILSFTHNSLAGIYSPEDIIRDYKILLSGSWVITFIVVLTIVLLLPVFSAIFLIGQASDTIRAEKNEMVHIEHAVKRLKSLNTILQGALQFLSLIIVFSVLTSSTLGESIKATIHIEGFDPYPKQMSYVYGLYFTVFLCIIYVPVYYQIRNNYNNLKELAIEMDLDDNPEHKDIYKSVFGDVKFEGSVLDHVKLAITILAPLLTGLLPNGMKLF